MSEGSIIIRNIEQNDLDHIMRIEEEAYGPHHWSRSSFELELDNKLARYYCAVNNKNEILGYLGSWNILDEAHIATLAISKNFRRHKIAYRLFIEFLDNCYKEMIKFITLEVRVSNFPAIALYKKFGLKSVGVRKFYYQDNNEDAYVMFSENIWDDKYKSIYIKNKQELERYINETKNEAI